MCQMLPADLTYYGARSYTASLISTVIITKCHQLSSVSLSVLCSKCLLYVDYVFHGIANWYFMFHQVLLTSNGEKVGR